ncbi:aminoglycoside phosphotransferase family protein [Actinoplanes hulinensis]|uniref:Aminoglycoside phosphotransferase family protein n=1 Tax=Actinoplanes hulinensis TaxID=1144547 RepID=A0ABS7BFI5_9ACTN|nr:aminoglycoside phosphotransferase family protein [Actinoplanes hulinensis]MBW6439605.1 aminoglycoside phosphotransferase family protein [Actinoplanes hulinensis]
MDGVLARLAPEQRDLLQRWIPGVVVEKDHSWGIVETTVLEMTRGDARFIVKAGGTRDHHMAREIHAHRNWLTPWTSRERAATMLHASTLAKLLVTTYLPGVLLLNSGHATDPAAFRQAGELLALLHGQTATVDEGYEQRENGRSLTLLDGPHRIAPPRSRRLRTLIESWPVPPATVVPTHGDWQPRNWLVHDGVVGVIDFGRAALRPAYTDFNRLVAQDFRDDPRLEQAFLEGYGRDPRTDDGWRRSRLREAIATACWAYDKGIEDFEAQGHRMIDEALTAV